VSEEQIERAVLHALTLRCVAGPGGGAVRVQARVRVVRAVTPDWLPCANSLQWISKRASRHCFPFRNGMGSSSDHRQAPDRRALMVSQPSDWVRQSVGLDGVCEPCALIASTRGRLVVPKTALDGVAVAIVADEWGLVS